MTYLELCQKMTRDLGLSNSVSTVMSQTGMNQKITDWIADADNEIQTKWSDWNFLWAEFSDTTSAGTLQYPAPSDFSAWDLNSFFLDYTTDDYVPLNYIEYLQWRQVDGPGVQTNDQPSSFTIAPNNAVNLEPIPDKAYALTANYWTEPTRLAADADETAIPTRFQRIIIARAKIYYAEHEEFPNVFELATKEYEHLLSLLEAAELPGLASSRTKYQSDIQLVIRPQ